MALSVRYLMGNREDLSSILSIHFKKKTTHGNIHLYWQIQKHLWGLLASQARKLRWRAGEMAQSVGLFATKPNNISSFPRTKTVEGEN